MPLLRRTLALFLLAAALATASAQILAHPGMEIPAANNGPWWQHAVIYQIEDAAAAGATAPQAPATDFQSITNHLDALRSLGVDALLLPMPSLPAQSQPDAKLDDFDDLVRQASAHSMRILLTLPVSDTAADLTGIARFWLNRGVAGFRVLTPPGTAPSSNQFVLQGLRKITGAAVGQRIVLTAFDPATAPVAAPAPIRTTRHAAPQPAAPSAQLQIDSRIAVLTTLDAATLRPLLTQTLTQPNLVLDIHPINSDLARPLAAVLLALHPTALLDAGANLTLPQNEAPPTTPEPPQTTAPTPPTPAPPPGTYAPYIPYVAPTHKAAAPSATPPAPLDPLTDWYRQLSQLHHANAVLRTGTPILLDFDQQNALVWAVRPATASLLTPPIVVACNLSSSPVKLAVGAAIKNLNLRGTYMRTLLRSDKSIGPQDLDAVTLPPYSVYIGELHR